MYYVPNLLTLWRLAATPILILLLKDRSFEPALVVFVLAGISDALDGYIAKRFGFETRLGSILDPVADKVLLVSCFVMLTLLGVFPFWLLIIVAFRDLLIIGGYLMLVTINGSVQMSPSDVSKINTVMQIVLISFALAQEAGGFHIPYAVDVLTVMVLVTTVWSGAQYVWVWGFGRPEPATPETDSKRS